VVVTGGVSADEAKFYRGTPQDASGNAKPLEDSLTVFGNKLVDVSYTGSSSIDNKGNGIPAIVTFQYFTLEKSGPDSDPFRFEWASRLAYEQKFIAALRQWD